MAIVIPTPKKDDIVAQAAEVLRTLEDRGDAGALAYAQEFLRTYAGEKSAFYKSLEEVSKYAPGDVVGQSIENILQSFVQFVEQGHLGRLSLERKVQVDVVSDVMEQANLLLNSRGVHPAAPIIIIGCALEEFLRNWVEDSALHLKGRKPSIDSYAKTLREAEAIGKQDVKDITAWGGLRNTAAHGKWEEVSDAKIATIMLGAVNLFMRKYATEQI